MAAVDGSTVEFTCTANNSDDISYRINGLSISSTEIVNSGLFEQALAFELLGDMILRRNLSVIVSSLYNNTEILCRASGTDTIVSSNPAILTVQGTDTQSLLSLYCSHFRSIIFSVWFIIYYYYY